MENTLQQNFRTANALLLICAVACLACYDLFGGLWLKGFTSVWFVVLGLVNVLYARRRAVGDLRFILLIMAGLVFGMCADVLLGVWFIPGILSFAMGHLMYLGAFCVLEKPRGKDLLIILPIACVSLFVVAGTPYIQIHDPLLKKLLPGYAVIIACMLGKAVSNLTARRSLSRILVLVGCVMFWFSDVMLAIDMFGESSRLTWVLCSYNYWPAQCILAHCLLHFVNEQAV